MADTQATWPTRPSSGLRDRAQCRDVVDEVAERSRGLVPVLGVAPVDTAEVVLEVVHARWSSAAARPRSSCSCAARIPRGRRSCRCRTRCAWRTHAAAAASVRRCRASRARADRRPADPASPGDRECPDAPDRPACSAGVMGGREAWAAAGRGDTGRDPGRGSRHRWRVRARQDRRTTQMVATESTHPTPRRPRRPRGWDGKGKAPIACGSSRVAERGRSRWRTSRLLPSRSGPRDQGPASIGCSGDGDRDRPRQARAPRVLLRRHRDRPEPPHARPRRGQHRLADRRLPVRAADRGRPDGLGDVAGDRGRARPPRRSRGPQPGRTLDAVRRPGRRARRDRLARRRDRRTPDAGDVRRAGQGRADHRASAADAASRA